MVLYSGYWSDWSITSRCYWLSVRQLSRDVIQEYVHPDDQTQPTFEMTPGFKPFTIKSLQIKYRTYG